MLFRFLLIFLVVLILYRAVRRLFLPWRKRDELGERERDVIHKGEMVRDPVCGTFVPRQGSISLMEGGREYFFCSPRCRDQFQHTGENGS
jgi:YHS domain-containing protein